MTAIAIGLAVCLTGICAWVAIESWMEMELPEENAVHLPPNVSFFYRGFRGEGTVVFPPNRSPAILHLTAKPITGSSPMAQRAVSINLVPPIDPTFAQALFTVTGSTVSGADPSTVDALMPTASFAANDGDIVKLIGHFANVSGSGPDSSPVYATIAAGTLAVSDTPPVVVVAPTVPPVVANLVAV